MSAETVIAAWSMVGRTNKGYGFAISVIDSNHRSLAAIVFDKLIEGTVDLV